MTASHLDALLIALLTLGWWIQRPAPRVVELSGYHVLRALRPAPGIRRRWWGGRR